MFLIRWTKLATSIRHKRLDDIFSQLLWSIDLGTMNNAPCWDLQQMISIKQDKLGSFPRALMIACRYGLDQFVEWTRVHNQLGCVSQVYHNLLLHNTLDGVLRGVSGCQEVVEILLESGIASRHISVKVGASSFESLWLCLLGVWVEGTDAVILRRYAESPPLPSKVWPLIAAFLNHGIRPACFLVWMLDKDKAKREELRRMLRGGSKDDRINLGHFKLDNGVQREWCGFRWRSEAILSTRAKCFLADLLSKHEETQESGLEPSITITCKDVLESIFPTEMEHLSPQPRERSRERKSPAKTPEFPRPAPACGGLSPRKFIQTTINSLIHYPHHLLACL